MVVLANLLDGVWMDDILPPSTDGSAQQGLANVVTVCGD
jgi:hypothetical protein